jgi:integrase
MDNTSDFFNRIEQSDKQTEAAGPSSPGAAQTIDDLLLLIPTWSDLPQGKRARLESSVRACSRIIARNQGITDAFAGSLPCDIARLNKTLFTRTPAAHRMERGTFANYVTDFRIVLRRASLLHDTARPAPPSSGPWEALLSGLNCTYAQAGLARFAAWCHDRGIMPDGVDSDILAAFDRFISTQYLLPDPRKKIGNIAKSWRRLMKTGAVQSSVWLEAPARRKPYTLPWSAFPESLEADVNCFAERLGGRQGTIFRRGDGPRKPLRPSSVKARLFSLRQAASALVLTGRDPATITSLACLVEANAFETILEHFWRHAINLKLARGELESGAAHPNEAGVTVQTGAIGTALMMVAKYHAKLDPVDVANLTNMAQDLRPDVQSGINEKTRRLLNELSVPATRVALLHLPAKLMQKAEELLVERDNRPPRPADAARLATVATAISILLMLPLRIGNLTNLRLDTHLRRFDPRRNSFSLLTIPPHEVKNNATIEWPIDPETGAVIERYVQKFRPLLNPGNQRWLFPSAHGERANARSIDAMRQGITGAVEEHVGVEMHVHAFRAFAAMLVLEDTPGALEDLRLLLGHKTLVTAQRFYAYMKPADAARRFSATMDRARKGNSSPGRRLQTAPSARPVQVKGAKR